MYQLFLPAQPLQPYIEAYWRLETEALKASLHQQALSVDGQADLLFTFAVPYQRRHLLNDTVTHAPATAHLDGQRDYPMQFAWQSQTSISGVRFRLAGIAPFVRVPMHHLSNLVVDVADIFGPSITRLEEQLYNCVHPQQQVALLDAYFLERLAPTQHQTLVQALIENILQPQGKVTIIQLAAEFGYSERTINRLFQRYMGFSPKFYARLARLRHAEQLLMHDLPLDLSEIALAVGYYDQSHFTKEFASFVGTTPSRYRHTMSALSSQPIAEDVRFLQDEVHQLVYNEDIDEQDRWSGV